MPTGSTEWALLLFLYLRGGYTSRREAAAELGLGEGRARRLLELFSARGLVETVRSGSRVTEAGRREVEEFLERNGFLAAAALRCSGLKGGGEYWCAAFHARGVEVWGEAVELRDCAVRAGAVGALVIVAGAERLHLPPGREILEDYLPGLAGEMKKIFDLRGGDLVLVPFAERLGGAVRGFLGMLGCLSRTL